MKHEDKNIQLSEKLEYLMAVGRFTVNVSESGQIVYVYINEKLNIYHISRGGRLLTFTNHLVEKFGLYPLIQKFHKGENSEIIKIQSVV